MYESIISKNGFFYNTYFKYLSAKEYTFVYIYIYLCLLMSSKRNNTVFSKKDRYEIEI